VEGLMVDLELSADNKFAAAYTNNHQTVLLNTLVGEFVVIDNPFVGGGAEAEDIGGGGGSGGGSGGGGGGGGGGVQGLLLIDGRLIIYGRRAWLCYDMTGTLLGRQTARNDDEDNNNNEEDRDHSKTSAGFVRQQKGKKKMPSFLYNKK
jgi:hypothetical protein